ncbi:CMRF35-like molecule 7 [Hippopotamus amphibius kiboko]|uniref:CMRF35-like molecule 7 n=1 Tax=Hippopotamus amphibius kiboko TaxID=575201 RepID=UPI00259A0774|nr:CMRF35-like molecule 7 [Hippopotamus amphibius kiboko]
MWLSPALLLLSLPGCFSIQGPGSVQGPERGSVTVQCHYRPGWETHVKWWCRGARWDTCRILVETRGSEQEVSKDRVSIKDDQRNRLFTVTMLRLRSDDTDTYWCGIEKTGIDLGTRIKVTVDPGKNFLVYTAGSWCSGLDERGPLPPPPRGQRGSQRLFESKTHYLLLAFLKVPILLILVGAVLWLKEPHREAEEQWEQPIYMNLSSDLLTKDTAP